MCTTVLKRRDNWRAHINRTHPGLHEGFTDAEIFAAEDAAEFDLPAGHTAGQPAVRPPRSSRAPQPPQPPRPPAPAPASKPWGATPDSHGAESHGRAAPPLPPAAVRSTSRVARPAPEPASAREKVAEVSHPAQAAFWVGLVNNPDPASACQHAVSRESARSEHGKGAPAPGREHGSLHAHAVSNRSPRGKQAVSTPSASSSCLHDAINAAPHLSLQLPDVESLAGPAHHHRHAQARHN